MDVKWVMGLIFIFVLATLFSRILDAQFLGSGETAILNDLLGFDIQEIREQGITGIPTATTEFFKSFLNAITWNYNFFTGEWVLVRYLAMAMTIGAIWGIIGTYGTAGLGALSVIGLLT